jgi:DNA-binding NtrC family response regulator
MRDSRRSPARAAGSQQLIGQSDVIDEVRRSIELAASSAVTVLLTGERGVGKTLIAQLIHRRSSRANSPFVTINPVRTSSVAFAADLATLAPGGTLVIEQAATLNPRMQAVLFRHLDCPPQPSLPSDRLPPARLIITTCQSLFAEVLAGQFNEDLFYRLNLIHLEIPPLRSRPDDVVPLAEHFLRTFRTAPGWPHVTPAVATALTQYSWPGNVRELKQAIRRMAKRRHRPARADDMHLAAEC